ncbi:MAG: glyoxalase superfamily protein [Bryobacteraceae bacterium]
MEFLRTVPILRIFSVEKAKEFYLGFLGFTIDWEHRFEEALPLYMQISRGNLVLHLSEHHGDGSPGASIRVEMTGLDEFHAELIAKKYGYGRPGIVEEPWGERRVTALDPFHNRIHFIERLQ